MRGLQYKISEWKQFTTAGNSDLLHGEFDEYGQMFRCFLSSKVYMIIDKQLPKVTELNYAPTVLTWIQRDHVLPNFPHVQHVLCMRTHTLWTAWKAFKISFCSSSPQKKKKRTPMHDVMSSVQLQTMCFRVSRHELHGRLVAGHRMLSLKYDLRYRRSGKFLSILWVVLIPYHCLSK
jgi:hypothetical protein